VVRFGEDFEFDFRAQKLSRSGRVLKLERIPGEVLGILIEQQGELVSRELIVERIWGKDVFLDTDNSINGAIRKIRQVLKDDPEEPRFIQTITGKGYRFIAPVVYSPVAASATVATEIVAPAGGSPKVETPPLTAGAELLLREDSGESSGRPSRSRASLAAPILILVTVILLVVAGAYFRWYGPRVRAPLAGGRTMLAVMPFENLTGDAGQEYFSDGLTEEMIAQLGGLDPDHMGVIARTSVMHYKHSQEPLQQIGRELGVQYVLEGSVRRDSDEVRIAAKLIQIRDQTQLWSRQYDRQPKDLLVLQSEIAREICDELQSALGEHKTVAAVAQPSLSPQAYEAYNLYLKGQYFWNKRTSESLRQAIDYYQQAIAKDPNDARAYAGLADCYALIGIFRGAPAGKFAPQARAAALRALQLDDKLPEAHTAFALIVQNFEYDWQTSEKEFKRAIELNPNYATAHHWYAEHLAWRGDFDNALRESEQARQLDPLSLIIAADNGAILYYARQYDKAIAQFNGVHEMDPNFSRAAIIFQSYIEKGMFTEAEAFVNVRADSAWGWSNIAYTYGRAGKRPEAERALQKVLEFNRREPVDPILIVEAYIGTGDADQAMAWLEKAYAQRSNALTGLKVDPVYDLLRGDVRFQNLVRRVGLGQ
jgi:TolB-like protein/DNA-binding winged helix-turn-helix (wHTH) protein/Tfp pilus assembly protein PilF